MYIKKSKNNDPNIPWFKNYNEKINNKKWSVIENKKAQSREGIDSTSTFFFGNEKG